MIVHKGIHIFGIDEVLTPDQVQQLGRDNSCEMVSWQMTAARLHRKMDRFAVLAHGRLRVFRTTDFGYKTVVRIKDFKITEREKNV